MPRSRSVASALLAGLALAGYAASAGAQAPATQVDSGGYHACAVTPAGGAACWGGNAEGMLGNGSNAGSSTPVPVTGLQSGVVAVALGEWHSCALTTAGSVLCWGGNVYEQLGVTGGNRNTPVAVPGLGPVVAIQGGQYHTCALTAAGGVKCWGSNFFGQLGDGGGNGHRAAPQDVAGLASGVKSIASGFWHTCALLLDDSARCWGRNDHGQLGNGTLAQNGPDGRVPVPVEVVVVADPIDAIAAGGSHTCVLSAGAARCWGRNEAGQLGDGQRLPISDPASLTAVAVLGMASGVAQIDAGYDHTCAVATTGTARCWGKNDHGQVGNGTVDATGVPVPAVVVGLPGDVAAISAALSHTCARTRGGSVLCFGYNIDGRVGNGIALPPPPLAQDVITAEDVVGYAVAAGMQSIDFAPPDTIGVAAPLALAAAAQSGLATTFDTWSPSTCTVSGTALVANHVGLCGVRASQAGGNGFLPAPAQLRILVVAKGAQAIVFGSIATKRYGDPPFPVPITASSGLPVAVSSLTPATCSVASNTATILSAATCTLAANQPGNADFNPAPGVTTDVVIGKGLQTITFGPLQNRALGGPPFQLSATASSGLTVSFASLTSTVCTVSASTVTSVAAGTCTIAANQPGGPNHEAAPQVTQSFTLFQDATLAPRLVNISTRMQVLTGDDVMIGGFVIGGTSAKRVAIVATGPSLAAYGITNPLPDPRLTLVRSSDQSVVAANDNWQSAVNASQLQAAGFAPSHPFEAAILIDLPPGAYTAIVQGAGSMTGVAVIGIYEVDHPESPLVNISTRGRVLGGDDVMIGGFVVQGTGSKAVAIVATGPSLSAYGIAQPLANPVISLVRSSDQQVIAGNDDWQSDANAAQLQAKGFAPSNALEAALLVTLPPGAYTVIVQGAGGGTAVIGVYAVD